MFPNQIDCGAWEVKAHDPTLTKVDYSASSKSWANQPKLNSKYLGNFDFVKYKRGIKYNHRSNSVQGLSLICNDPTLIS